MGTDYYQADGADDAVVNNIDQTANQAAPTDTNTNDATSASSDDQNSSGAPADATPVSQPNSWNQPSSDQNPSQTAPTQDNHEEPVVNSWEQDTPKSEPTPEPTVEPGPDSQPPKVEDVPDEPEQAKPWEAPLDEPEKQPAPEPPQMETPPASQGYSSASFDPTSPAVDYSTPPVAPEAKIDNPQPGQDGGISAFEDQLIQEISKSGEATSQESISERVFMARANGTITAKIDNQGSLNDEQMRKAYELWDWQKAGEILNKIGADKAAL
jgi:hypothetical protein